jgi:hypothetical protein
MTLCATLTLAVVVLLGSPSDYRIAVCVIVSLAAITLAVRSLFSGKLVWILVFLGVLGVFTPFQHIGFSHTAVSILDMAALALFATSPLLLRKSNKRVVLSTTARRS